MMYNIFINVQYDQVIKILHCLSGSCLNSLNVYLSNYDLIGEIDRGFWGHQGNGEGPKHGHKAGATNSSYSPKSPQMLQNQPTCDQNRNNLTTIQSRPRPVQIQIYLMTQCYHNTNQTHSQKD